MARSARGAGEPPRAGAAAGSSGSAPRPGAQRRGNRVAWWLVAVGMVRHALGSRPFYEKVALALIALASLRGIGKENRASMMARVAAWNKREIQRLEHKAERQVGAVKGSGRTARSGPPRTEGGGHGS
jgi:hypothetical protein